MSHPHTPHRAHAGIRKIAHQTPKSPHHPHGRHDHIRCLDARNHYPQIKHHTPPPKRGDNQLQSLSPVSHTRDEEIAGLLSQSPIVCLAIPSPASITRIPYRLNVCRAPEPHPLQAQAHPTNRPARGDPRICGPAWVSWCSLERR